jgi:UDP-2-acetamido-3-amino-2,3-dideoxy-glucuronate N-acetyltransferase
MFGISRKKQRNYFIDPIARVDKSSIIWEDTRIRENVQIGAHCNIGRNVYIGPGVIIGNNVKIQNNALIYEPAIIKDGVFIGPGVIFTNDLNPRAVNVDGEKKNENDWKKTGVEVYQGASLGAGVICVAPVKIGHWAMVAAGSVVTRDVEDFELVAGVPAARIGWVGKAGTRLIEEKLDSFKCPTTGTKYLLIDGKLTEQL